jgi:hypothetical protein
MGNTHSLLSSSDLFELAFNEAGLPTGATWEVSVNGTSENGTGASIVFSEPNGTYGYSIAPIPGYATTWAGTVAINGTNLTVPVAFSVVTYGISFTESGLPSGTNWTVTLGASAVTSTATTILFSRANGTYSYTIAPIAGYTSTRSGSVVLNGSTVAIAVVFTQVRYPLVFSQSGLPAGTLWTVKVGSDSNSSNTTSVGFLEPNGTYAWAITPIAGYTTTWTGNVTIAATNATVTAVFTQVTYSLTFAETGLPTGTRWTVTIGSNPRSSTTGSIVFTEANGTYGWSITPIPGYTTTWKGSVTIAGASAAVAATFTQVVYPLVFSESGLPSGSTWSVKVGSTVNSSASGSIGFAEPNGTFTWAITPIPGYTTTWKGNVTVDGSSVTVPVAFAEVEYSLSFSEVGLPSSTSWEVTILSVSEASTTSRIDFSEPNGTFAWAITPIAGYATTWSGNATIAGGDAVVEVGFTQVTYSLSFIERRLPAGTDWAVTVGTVAQESTAGEITFTEPNGTYGWSVDPIAGYTTSGTGSATVEGSDVWVDVVFLQVSFPVIFTETGLPAGTPWAVSVGNSSVSGQGSSLQISEPNGSYTYDVLSIPGFTTARTGSFTMDGGSLNLGIDFQAVLYAVDFRATGLPNGTAWSVSLAGTVGSTLAGTIRFEVANGSYGFRVTPVAGFVTAATGVVEVNGADQAVGVAFVPFLSNVTFLAIGLPVGTSWTVTLAGQTFSSAAGPLTFAVANGTYGYTVLGIPGYSTTWSGSITVQGQTLLVTVRFTQVTYAIAFTETGLPAGSAWAVTVGTDTVRGTSDLVIVTEPNGSYTYEIFPLGGYATAWSGTVEVTGASRSIAVVFLPFTYGLAFRESRLPAGTNWSVTLEGAFGSQTQRGTGAETVTFDVANGTYTFRASAAGFLDVAGTVAVAGATPPTVIAQMVSSAPAPAPSSGPPAWELVTLALVAIAIVAAALLVRRRRSGPPRQTPRDDRTTEPEGGEETPDPPR